MSVRRPWAYRPWKGFGLCGLGFVVDFYATTEAVPGYTPMENGGLIFFAAFAMALIWALYGPQEAPA